MVDDIAYRICHSFSVRSCAIPNQTLQVQLLKDLASLFSDNGLTLSLYDLPVPPDGYESSLGNRLITEELSYDRVLLES